MSALIGYRNTGSNQVVWVPTHIFAGNPLWELIIGDGGGGGGDVTQQELDDHAADGTNIHGIADTSLLATDSDVDAAVEAHRVDTTDVHGIVNTGLLATQAQAQGYANAAAALSVPLTQRGVVNGVATLDNTGKIPQAQVPSITITDNLAAAADQAAMLALSGQLGDWTIRLDTSTVWIIIGADPTQLSSWRELAYPTAPVSSVAGRTGSVTLTAADIASGTFDVLRLPVGTAGTQVAAGNDSRITGALQATGNLAGLASTATARTNLGLGGSATLSVGTTAGTVAAGNDPRFGAGGGGGGSQTLVINVKDAPFGAAGNGTTNDTSAITAALAAANAVGGGIVYFPPGLYMTDGGHNIPAYVHIVGSEPASRYWTYNAVDMPPSACALKLRVGTAQTAMFSIGAGSTAFSLRNITLLGAQIAGNKSGIAFANPSQEHNSLVQDVAIIGFSGDGVRGRLFATRWDELFIGSNQGYGLNCDSANSWTDSWFTGAIITGNILGGVNFASSVHCGEVSFTDCRFERSGWDPANPSTPTATASPGIRIVGNLIGASFVGCSTDANSGSGVDITRADTSVSMHHIAFTNCRFNRDGFGTMAGGSAPDRAAVHIAGAVAARIGYISFSNCFTTEGKAVDDGSSPAYIHAKWGLWWVNVDYLTWEGGGVSEGHPGGQFSWSSVWRPLIDIAAPAGVATWPVWTTGTRPATNVIGMHGFNETTAQLEVWNGSSYVNVDTTGGGGGGVTLTQLNAKTFVTVARTSGADYTCDGTADQVEIQQAIDAVIAAGGGTVFIKAGQYNLTAGLDVNGPVNGLIIAGEGMLATKLTCSQTNDDPGIAVGRGNSIAADITLTVSTVLGSRTVTLSNASTISVGDWLLLKSDKPVDLESSPPTKFAGEMLQVTGKTGNVLDVHDVVKDTYLTSDNARVAKVVMPTGITLRDFTISLPLTRLAGASDLSTGFLDFRFVHNLTISRVEMGPAYHSLQLRSCVNVAISDCYIHDMQEPTSANLRYGVWVGSASHNVAIHGCRFRGVRHAVTTGTNSGSNGNGVQRNIIVSACVSEQSDTAHFDCHQPCDGVLFVGCTAIGGMVYGAISGQAVIGYQSRGRNVAFLNCQAMNIPGRGFMIQGSESDNTRIIGCTAANITEKLGGGEGVGIYVDTGGSTRHIISNNMVINCTSSGLNLGGGPGANDCVITGNVFDTVGTVVTTAATKVTNGSRGVFANNRVLNCPSGAPFQLLGTATNWQIYGNSFINNLSNVPVLLGTNTCENNIGCNPDFVNARGNATGAVTIDLATGTTQTMTLTGNVTFTLGAGVCAGNKLRLIMTQDGTGSRTTTFAAAVVLAGNAYVPSTAAASVSTLDLMWSGTAWIETARMTNGS